MVVSLPPDFYMAGIGRTGSGNGLRKGDRFGDRQCPGSRQHQCRPEIRYHLGPGWQVFTSLLPGAHVIEFYYVGYENLRREISLAPGADFRLDVSMKIGRRMLDEVVVSAGKYEQKLSDVTVSMEVLKPQLLSSQNITSLDEILEKTSGISILDGQPSIRGGSGFSYGVGSRVLMLVDDLPMISGDAGDIKWNYMPVENLNQVEVIKGASSVLYGSSALNGVINLRTRFPGNEPQTEVTLFGGTYMDPQRRELIWWDQRPLFTGTSFSHLRKAGNLDLSLGGTSLKTRATVNLSMKKGSGEMWD
jgi:hypothetical protein